MLMASPFRQDNSLPYIPRWCRLTEINPKGTVPILKDNKSGKFVVGSDTISDYLEAKYGPSSGAQSPFLGKQLADHPEPALNLWPHFMNFLAGVEDKSNLERELNQIESAVSDASPYIGGQSPNAYDIAIAPRLYLARVVCQAMKVHIFRSKKD